MLYLVCRLLEFPPVDDGFISILVIKSLGIVRGFSNWRVTVKQLQLKDAMQRFTITAHENGYEVSNQAGTAQYDAWGARTTVNGIPEYFPRSISVKDGTKPDVGADGRALPVGEFSGKVKAERQHTITLAIKADTTDLDKLEAQLKRIAEQRQQVEGMRPFLTCQAERSIREAITKAITKALHQGGCLHESMRR